MSMFCVTESLKNHKCNKIMFQIYVSILIINNWFQLNYHKLFIVNIIIFRSNT
jgi:uncharacterized membrane protein YsdA (DUF1294 family)